MLVVLDWERRGMVVGDKESERCAYARPMEKMKQRRSFFLVWSCRCQITGIGIRKIQMSVMRLDMFVK